MTNTNLNRFSSAEHKKSVSDTVYDALSKVLFEKVVFVTLIFSEALNTDGSAIISTTNLIGTSRITDTSEGRYLNTGKESRMRCSFYLSNPDKLTGYILSPAVYDSFSSLNSISSMNILRSYVGLKFNLGDTFVAVKEAGGAERLYPTQITYSGSGSTDTYELEIIHNVRSTDIYVNRELIGSYASDLVGDSLTTKTFLPLLSPAKSSDGSAVGLVIENYQFIQDK